jgi:4-hydroxybenzoate polyprenyltransferase
MQFRAMIHGWLRLLRVPNLFTVPGDPIAGAVLVGAMWWDFYAVALAVFTSLAIYVAGLIINDLADYDEDARDRPERPLPSKAVSRSEAWIVVVVLLVEAIVFAIQLGRTPLIVVLVLVALIFAYNFSLKRSALFGPLALGCCRGASFLLGASAINGAMGTYRPIVWIAAATLCTYIVTISILARSETSNGPKGRAWLLPALVPLGLVVAQLVRPAQTGLVTLGILIPWIVIAWRAAQPQIPAPRSVGILIRCVLLLQAYFVCARGALFLAIALILLYPISAALGKRFYAS